MRMVDSHLHINMLEIRNGVYSSVMKVFSIVFFFKCQVSVKAPDNIFYQRCPFLSYASGERIALIIKSGTDLEQSSAGILVKTQC